MKTLIWYKNDYYLKKV